MRPLRTGLFAALLALLATSGLQAQELAGIVRQSDGRTAASGVILEATRVGDSRPLARVISGENGAFVLRVPAGEFALRALRIGYRPTDLGRHSLAEGERRRVEFTLGDRTVVLATLTTRATSRCESVARAGETVAALFTEARTALLSSQLTPPEGRPSARILLEHGVLTPDGRASVAPVRVVGSGFAARPFRSAPPAQLAALGYAILDPDGTTYFAPDANVLLSDQFVATHCLRLARADTAHPGRVGIAFEPVGRARGLVRIRGTIWLDSATFGLERLDFEYTGLPAALSNAKLGGSIDFAHLPDGLWFEDRWEIRMPRVRITRAAGAVAAVDGSADVIKLDAIQTAGGRVLSIARADRVLYTSAGNEPGLAQDTDPDALLTATLFARVTCDAIGSDDATQRSAVVGLVGDASARPTSGARVEANWQERHRLGPDGTITWAERTVSATTEDDGFYALCGLPRERRFELQAFQGERRTPRTVLRFEADADRMRFDPRFNSSP